MATREAWGQHSCACDDCGHIIGPWVPLKADAEKAAVDAGTAIVEQGVYIRVVRCQGCQERELVRRRLLEGGTTAEHAEGEASDG